VGAILIACPVLFTDIFCGVSTDLELDHYAEKSGWAIHYLPSWLPLPANTFVNVGYVIVGVLWLLRITRLQNCRRLSAEHCYDFYVFSWMSFFYGQVQCIRLITRFHWSAVLDQWYTLPIFAWVGIWSGDVCHQLQCGRSLAGFTRTVLVLSSMMSYGLALWHELGFEVALAIHIVLVATFAWRAHSVAPFVSYQKRTASFLKALLCCAGFVVLKLADHRLAAIWPPFFTILSGHFWSKVADFLQIHYTCQFSWNHYLTRR
jgi:hypothetical protein